MAGYYSCSKRLETKKNPPPLINYNFCVFSRGAADSWRIIFSRSWFWAETRCLHNVLCTVRQTGKNIRCVNAKNLFCTWKCIGEVTAIGQGIFSYFTTNFNVDSIQVNSLRKLVPNWSPFSRSSTSPFNNVEESRKSNCQSLVVQNVEGNKTVLLRERKRHTARRVARTGWYLAWLGGGYPLLPILTWPGGTYLDWGWEGVPPSWPGWGVPTLAREVPTLGVPPSWPGWGRGHTYLGQEDTYLGVPPCPDLAGGYLPWPGGTYLGVPLPILPWLGGYLPCGTPLARVGTPHLDLAKVGTSPPNWTWPR